MDPEQELELLEMFGSKFIAEVRDKAFLVLAKTLAGHLGDQASEALHSLYSRTDIDGRDAVDRLVAHAIDTTLRAVLEFDREYRAAFRFLDGKGLDLCQLKFYGITIFLSTWIKKWSKYPGDYTDPDSAWVLIPRP